MSGLKKIMDDDGGGINYLHFANITPLSSGTGVCMCYNAYIKKTRNGKPFATLQLRDIDGAAIPAYVFDMASPIASGADCVAVIGQVVEIKWRENYLPNIGLTLILEGVAVKTDITDTVRRKFFGEVENKQEKLKYIHDFFFRELQCRIRLPQFATSPNYMQGRVGGLLEYYYRMCKVLSGVVLPNNNLRRDLVSTFVIYIYTHSAYVRAKDMDEAHIDLVTTMMTQVSGLASQLSVGSAAMELVHMFFGYTPKDIFVKTIANIGDFVQRIDKEFVLYSTIPVHQEGDAGYGAIRRYKE